MSNVVPYMIKDDVKARAESAGWNIKWDTWDALSPYEKSFFEIEFTGIKTVKYYEDRLRAIGFSGMDSVLDVACGMGQWSVALAALNKQATGIDMNVGRLLFANDLSSSMGHPQTRFVYASMEKMDFPSEAFDGVFCYGSFMFGRMDKTLDEFYRLLKKGGRAYINANMVGWYAHLLIDRGLKKRNLSMIRSVLSMAARTLLGKTDKIIVRRRWLETLIKERGFDIIASGGEGAINLNSEVTLPQPAYPEYYYGLPSILEFVIEKR
ncbi:class I SAM-dependent methyltransferase [Micavibrio aeruginosavorus]|uniref:class I SAM-dependent methyltransferase n=1 Tax=Micavibrio aeruginosavorus TaxID=349221 RepID=UPI003F4AA898